MGSHTDRTHAWSAATMRDGKGFVEIEVHQVKAQITRTNDPKQGIEIRSVTIHQAAATVHQLNYLLDVLIEEAKRIRVSQHHANDRVVTGGFQGFEIHIATLIRWDLHNLQSH